MLASHAITQDNAGSYGRVDNILEALKQCSLSGSEPLTKSIILTPGKSGYTPLHLAARDGFLNLLPLTLLTSENLLFEVSGSKVIRSAHLTPLALAARNGHLHQIPASILTDSNLMKPGFKGRTALHEAAGFGYLDQIPKEVLTVENLLQLDERGMTPLHLAADPMQLDVLLGMDFRGIYSDKVKAIVGEGWWEKNLAIVHSKAALSEGIETNDAPDVELF